MRYAYIRSIRKKEVDTFIQQTRPDQCFVDLRDDYGNASDHALQALQQQLGLGEDQTVVLLSIENAFESLKTLKQFFELCTRHQVQVEILSCPVPVEQFYNVNGMTMLDTIQDFLGNIEETERKVKKGRPLMPYPQGFYEVYGKYKSGEMKMPEASRQLGISNRMFYKIIQLFEL